MDVETFVIFILKKVLMNSTINKENVNIVKLKEF